MQAMAGRFEAKMMRLMARQGEENQGSIKARKRKTGQRDDEGSVALIPHERTWKLLLS